MNGLSQSLPPITLAQLNRAVDLAETLAAHRPADQHVQGLAVAHAFQDAVALLEEMQRRLRLAHRVMAQLASTST